MKHSILVRSVVGAMCALMVGVGCNQSSPGNASGGHSHGADGHSHSADSHGREETETEEKTAQIIVWTDRFEVFAEHKAPVAGETTEFITHISHVQSGEPMSSGLIQFQFSQPGTEFAHSEAAPARPGIYLPAIKFPSQGLWKATLTIPGTPAATIDLGSIRVHASAEVAKKAEFPEPPEGIAFLKEQQWRIRARSVPATKRTLTQRIPLYGTVIPAPGSKALVHSTVTGTLLAVDGALRLGSRVKAGDIIAWVQPAFGEFTTKLVEAEAEAIRTKAALDQAQITFERTKRLFEQQAKSERELKEAEVALRTAQASHEAAAAVQNLYRGAGASFEGGTVKIGIAAPINGVLDRAFALAGARVTADEPVFSIVNPGAAFVQAQLPESRRGDIAPESTATFVPSGDRTNALALKLVAIGKEIDSSTRTIPLTFEFIASAMPASLGGIGTVHVGAERSADVVAIPASAIVEEEGIPVAFVQVSGETFQKRDVTVGIRDSDWIEIKTGVGAGERVVTEGAYAILLSTKTGAIPDHGHAH